MVFLLQEFLRRLAIDRNGHIHDAGDASWDLCVELIESGKREPTLRSVEKIAAALGVPTAIMLFMAAEKGDLTGLDADTSRRLSDAALDVIRA